MPVPSTSLSGAPTTTTTTAPVGRSCARFASCVGPYFPRRGDVRAHEQTSFAQEAIEHGIRVNAVAPGPMWTPLIPATMPEDKVDYFGADESPMKRAGQAAELAPVYVFLASQESSMSGSNACLTAPRSRVGQK